MSKCILCNEKSYKQRLGHSTWEFLSHMIEGYPFYADEIEQKYMKNFITALSYAYPCHECRPGFIKYVEDNEPDVRGKEELFKYFQGMRDHINSKIQ